jgi:hypothetical protein
MTQKIKSELLKYRATLGFNREVFLLNYGQEFKAFEDTNIRLQKIIKVVSKIRSDQNESHVGLVPLLMIIARQAISALECLSQYRGYEAWLVFRPALESALIIGKFLDNPANAELWLNRKQIWKERKENKKRYNRYKKEFEGNGLISESLPEGEKFRQLRTRINDEFVHMNFDYLIKHCSTENADSQSYLYLSFVDEEYEHKAYLFSFLQWRIIFEEDEVDAIQNLIEDMDNRLYLYKLWN